MSLADAYEGVKDRELSPRVGQSGDFLKTISAISAEFVLDQCIMQNNKSPGLDQFNVRLFELARPFISLISNWMDLLSLMNGKKGKVTPIFKLNRCKKLGQSQRC